MTLHKTHGLSRTRREKMPQTSNYLQIIKSSSISASNLPHSCNKPLQRVRTEENSAWQREKGSSGKPKTDLKINTGRESPAYMSEKESRLIKVLALRKGLGSTGHLRWPSSKGITSGEEDSKKKGNDII